MFKPDKIIVVQAFMLIECAGENVDFSFCAIQLMALALHELMYGTFDSLASRPSKAECFSKM